MRPDTNRNPNAARFVGPLAVGVLALMAVTALVYQLWQTNASLNAQIADLQSQILNLKQRWYGTPALWQPPAITNTDFKYFDVKGTTQRQLVDSLDHSGICTQYGPCGTDPAVPNGVAWGLEGFTSVGSSVACYSPSSTVFEFREYVVLPRWSPAADGTVQIPLVESWNALSKVIYTHEAGHVAITQKDLADLNHKAQGLGSCDAVGQFWADPHVFDQLKADQDAYHARLHADCRPEVGCLPPGWRGW